jgi:hypothetical protein
MIKVESNVKIYFSKTYGDFKMLKGNRDIDPKKIKKIKAAIEDEGIDILKYAPIIVDEKMRIIDGQHRYQVCRELKRPVHYVVIEKADLKEVAKINSNSSSWKVKDFLNSFVDLKRPAYEKIVELRETYNVTPLVLGGLLNNGHAKVRNLKEIFCDGLIKINFLDITIIMLELLKDFEPFMDNPYSQRMLEAMAKLKDNGLYDHGKMIAKLQQTARRIDRVESVKSIIQNMEEIMNINAQKRVIIFQ